eukprot:9243552-Pyramimonas_sp.AAC.1
MGKTKPVVPEFAGQREGGSAQNGGATRPPARRGFTPVDAQYVSSIPSARQGIWPETAVAASRKVEAPEGPRWHDVAGSGTGPGHAANRTSIVHVGGGCRGKAAR